MVPPGSFFISLFASHLLCGFSCLLQVFPVSFSAGFRQIGNNYGNQDNDTADHHARCDHFMQNDNGKHRSKYGLHTKYDGCFCFFHVLLTSGLKQITDGRTDHSEI